MSRKDYRAIAAVLNNARKRYPDSAIVIGMITTEIGRYCKKDNPHFDWDTFLAAVTKGTLR